MKIYLQCQSPLLQSTLEFFLKDYLCELEECDMIVSDCELELDNDILCYVGEASDTHKPVIKKPFSKTSLLSDLEAFYKNLKEKRASNAPKLHFENPASIEDSIHHDELESIIKEAMQTSIDKLNTEFDENLDSSLDSSGADSMHKAESSQNLESSIGLEFSVTNNEPQSKTHNLQQEIIDLTQQFSNDLLKIIAKYKS